MSGTLFVDLQTIDPISVCLTNAIPMLIWTVGSYNWMRYPKEIRLTASESIHIVYLLLIDFIVLSHASAIHSVERVPRTPSPFVAGNEDIHLVAAGPLDITALFGHIGTWSGYCLSDLRYHRKGKAYWAKDIPEDSPCDNMAYCLAFTSPQQICHG